MSSTIQLTNYGKVLGCILITIIIVMRSYTYYSGYDELHKKTYTWPIYIYYTILHSAMLATLVNLFGYHRVLFYIISLGALIGIYDVIAQMHQTLFSFAIRVDAATFGVMIVIGAIELICRLCRRYCCCCYSETAE